MPARSTVSAETWTAIGENLPDRGRFSELQSGSMVAGMPTASDVGMLTVGTPHVRDELKIGSGGVVYGAGYLGAAYPGDGSGLASTHDASADFEFDLASLGDPHRLRLGLLSDAATAGGFDSLSFSVTANGSALQTWHFTSLTDASHMFNDQVVNIGSFLSGAHSSGTLDLGLSFSLDSHTPLQGYNIAFLIGAASPTAVPEPSISIMLGIGLAFLVARRYWIVHKRNRS